MSDGKRGGAPIGRPIARDCLVTREDLDRFKRELLTAIQAMLVSMEQSRPKKWLKSYEVRKLLNISAGTLQTLRNNGTLPFSKIGNIVYFDANVINEVMLSRSKK